MWINPSCRSAYEYCPRSYYYRYIEKRREQTGTLTHDGVNAHDVFAVACANIDVNHMMSLPIDSPYYNGPVYKYLKHLALGTLTPKQINIRIKRIIQNWATFMAEYWYELREKFGLNTQIISYYYLPFLCEHKIRLEGEGYDGKLDAAFNYSYNGERCILVLDYKTGNVPQAILDCKNTLRTKDMKQLHHYVYMLSKTRNLPVKRFLVGILYLGDMRPHGELKHKPWFVMKKANMRSLNVVLKANEELKAKRKATENIVDYPPIYNPFVCEGLFSTPASPCEYCESCWKAHERGLVSNLS